MLNVFRGVKNLIMECYFRRHLSTDDMDGHARASDLKYTASTTLRRFDARYYAVRDGISHYRQFLRVIYAAATLRLSAMLRGHGAIIVAQVAISLMIARFQRGRALSRLYPGGGSLAMSIR